MATAVRNRRVELLRTMRRAGWTMIKSTTRVAILGVLATIPITLAASELDACTVLSADEVKAALGRQALGAANASTASGGYSDCRFPGIGAGDVRIILSPPTSIAPDDFDLKAQIYADEGKNFEKIAGIGDGAYYWDDTIEFRVGNRIVSLWVNRTPGTEAPAAVKGALTALAMRAADRMGAVR